jgi:hypothetical protein
MRYTVRRDFEKPQKGSGITVDQHVFPEAIIKRFAGSSGKVCLFDKVAGLPRNRYPKNEIFCAKRVWDQRAEAGPIKAFYEDPFLRLASGVVDGSITSFDDKQQACITSFFGLWEGRARFRDADGSDISLVATGGNWTKDEEERFEKANVMYVRMGGKLPSRFVYGFEIQKIIDWYLLSYPGLQWSTIRAMEGQFVVPDYPSWGFIPISPTMILCARCKIESQLDGAPIDETQELLVVKDTVADINRHLRAGSVKYYFAQDMQQTP